MKLIINTNDFYSKLKGKPKFYADAFIYDDERYHIIMKGVNYKFRGTKRDDNINYCISAYEKKGSSFIKSFRGSFAGALFDKQKEKWLVFTNHFGDQQLFYAQTKDSIIISSSIFEVNEVLKSKNITQNLDVESAYQLLSYGYFIGDRTLIKEIKKIEAGHYLEIENGLIEKNAYYKIDNTPNSSLNERDCVENIDNLFKKAIELEFEKDVDYKLKHLATLSGGLDSRMTVWVAHMMGYQNLTNITFSQLNYLDTQIAHQISSHLNTTLWMTFALDGGNHLINNIDKIIRNSNALYHFSGASALMAMNMFEFSEYGSIHTGMLGDVIIGTYSAQGAYDVRPQIKSTSKKMLHRIDEEILGYANNETANLYVRGCNGILINNSILQKNSEVASPFLDVDFFNFCMSIPIELRANHKIYKKWLLKKHPKAADFKWENINAKLTNKSFVLRNKIIPARHLHKYIIEGFFHNIGSPINDTWSKQHMNPFNYWFKNNNLLKEYVNNYFDEHIDLITESELKKDCKELFLIGNAIEKCRLQLYFLL